MDVTVPLSCPNVGEAVLVAITAIRLTIKIGISIIRVKFRIVCLRNLMYFLLLSLVNLPYIKCQLGSRICNIKLWNDTLSL